MTKPRKMKPFCGHQLWKMDHYALVSLVNFTSLPFGVAKRDIKSEAVLWAFTDAVYGLRPAEGEDFIKALRRIRGKVASMTPLGRHMAQERARTKFAAAGLPTASSGVVAARPKRERKQRFKAPKDEGGKASKQQREDFYKSWEWRTLRMTVLKKHGPRCMCCGSTPDQTALHGAPVRIVVDHIKPLFTHWHLRLDADNLQVLCDECNMGKGAWDTTDWRADETEISDEPLSAIEQQLGERFRVIEGGAA